MKDFAAMLEDLRSWLRLVRRAMKPGPRHLSKEERRVIATMHRDGIRRELANRSAATLEHEDGQQVAYWRLWRSIPPATKEAVPPEILDPSVSNHIALALSVVGDYDAAREEPGEFADCLYRPVSDLPYPQAAIRRSCEFLIGIADADPGSFAGDHELLVKEREALGLALFSLDYFLDLPASEIPRRKLQNLAYVKHQYLTRSLPPVKPGPGDTVIRSGSGDIDCVNQVIGLRDNDEWMVLTNSGVVMQVVRNAELGKWDELKEIAPAAAASWLTLTPSAGTPGWG